MFLLAISKGPCLTETSSFEIVERGVRGDIEIRASDIFLSMLLSCLISCILGRLPSLVASLKEAVLRIDSLGVLKSRWLMGLEPTDCSPLL